MKIVSSNNYQKRMLRMAAALLLVFLFIVYINHWHIPFFPDTKPNSHADVSVHFIDVGQGDSILIKDHEKSILIDGGENAQGNRVVQYLKREKVTHLNYVVATHPHSDHIGGLITVLQWIPADQVFIPDIPESLLPTDVIYKKFLQTISSKKVQLKLAAPGDTFDLQESNFKIIGPIGTYHSLNDYSIVSKLEIGDYSFLFTGDAEKEAEKDLVNAKADLHSTVLKAGHHGSSTSSTSIFLNAVQASCYVISVGENNAYGHPSKKVLERLGENADIYRTDIDGNIIFEIFDRAELRVKTVKT